jgi:ATP-dependent DNA ligase
VVRDLTKEILLRQSADQIEASRALCSRSRSIVLATDGVIAKRLDAPYRAGERTMIKVKHERTADCVVAGFRWHKKGAGTMIGSLLLGLYDDDHTLHHVGVAAAFTATVRKQLVVELTPLRTDAFEDHPWRDWAVSQEEASAKGQRPARCDQPVEPRERSELGAAPARARL